MPFRVLITGSRTWTNEAAIADALRPIWEQHGSDVVLIHGTARGADRIAGRLAARAGWGVEEYPADWDGLGRKAGHVRNAEMVATGADVCLAFIRDGSAGATGCAKMASRAGIPVVVCAEDATT